MFKNIADLFCYFFVYLKIYIYYIYKLLSIYFSTKISHYEKINFICVDGPNWPDRVFAKV